MLSGLIRWLGLFTGFAAAPRRRRPSAAIIRPIECLEARSLLAVTQVALVPTGAAWKYLDTGVDAGTAWRGGAFDDATWAIGNAQLGYGDGDESTIVSYGLDPGNKRVTTYFRHSFGVASAAEFIGLAIGLKRDDGAVVYLNGQEAARSNMPAGPVAYNTLATTALSGAAESTFVNFNPSAALLVDGVNVLAVEIHQADVTSSDISFDLQLIGTQSIPSAPSGLAISDVTVVEPSSGSTNAVFTVSLPTASTGTVTVQFATAGNTATSGLDFIASSGTLTFTSGETTKTIAIAVASDGVDEAIERFRVSLSGATGAPIADADGYGTIIESDIKPPDLTPLTNVAKGWLYGSTIDTTTIPGRTLLRFATTIGNLGTGPIELRGASVNPDGTHNVNQRVYDSSGGFVDQYAGTFTYHAGHAHLHYSDFAVYNLRESLTGGAIGDVVAMGGKVSFCLRDIEKLSLGLPGTPATAQYTSCNTFQGISVGWADVYPATLVDQWIDITGVADGSYWLEVVLDPVNRLVETNEANNVARVPVQLGAIGTGDRFEPNDSFAGAADLGSLVDRTENDLSIHSSGNDDYYRVTAVAPGTLTVTFTFAHAAGDVDVFLYDAAQNQIDISDSATNAEQLSATVVAGQTYFIRVIGYQGATNPDYDMVIDAPSALPVVSIVATDAAAAETLAGSSANTGTFTVSRTGSTSASLAVQLAISGAASNGADYFTVATTFTIAAGQGSATLTITPIDDTIVESSETVIVSLAANSAYAVDSTKSSATVSIADNDVAASAVVSVTASDRNAAETVAGATKNTGKFTVKRTGSTSAPLSVQLAVGGAATAGSDYVPIAGTVTIAAGSSSASITVTAIDDSIAEPAEVVVITVAAGSGYSVDAKKSKAAVTVKDNDGVVQPLNDHFVNRIALTGSTATSSGTNLDATSEPGEPNNAGVSGGKSVWWSWTAGATRTVTVTTAGSNFDSTLGVYTGSTVSSLSVVASNDDEDNAAGILTSLVSFQAIAGQTYYISIDGWAGATGGIVLSII